MPKYRTLTTEELQGLKKEFINYLIVNGIDADEWKKIQSTDPSNATEITELFSDVVFEKVMRQTQYLRHTTTDSITCFHYQKETAVMIGIKSSSGSIALDESLSDNLLNGVYELITGNKAYTLPREVELYAMTLKGAAISDGSLYKELAKLL